jgi:hypothetical protein
MKENKKKKGYLRYLKVYNRYSIAKSQNPIKDKGKNNLINNLLLQISQRHFPNPFIENNM